MNARYSNSSRAASRRSSSRDVVGAEPAEQHEALRPLDDGGRVDLQPPEVGDDVGDTERPSRRQQLPGDGDAPSLVGGKAQDVGHGPEHICGGRP